MTQPCIELIPTHRLRRAAGRAAAATIRESAAPAPAKQEAALAGAPAPLAKLHAQANELLGGGADAFDARLRELKGYPGRGEQVGLVVRALPRGVPLLPEQSVKRGKEIAFLGVDGNDNDGDAREFLESSR